MLSKANEALSLVLHGTHVANRNVHARTIDSTTTLLGIQIVDLSCQPRKAYLLSSPIGFFYRCDATDRTITQFLINDQIGVHFGC